MFKYVLIDVDGTLLDFKLGEKNAIKETINHFFNYELNNDEINKYSDINEFYFKEYQNDKMKRSEFHFNRFNEFIKYLGFKGDVIEINNYYLNSLKYQAILYDDILDNLLYLSKKYKLFVASNGMTNVQKKRLEIANIDKYFIKNYVSEEVGYNKPDKKFFDYIFKDLNDFDNNNYVIIGDRLDSDILGGINTNIKTIYLNRKNILNDIKPDYVISSFNEIKNIL